MNPGLALAALTGSPAERLAEGFARQLRDWARGAGADEVSQELVEVAGRALSLATSAGHVCLWVRDLDLEHAGLDEAAARARLLASGVVGSPAAPGAMPLILDAHGRLYLHRYFDYETRLARRVLAAAQAAPREIDLAMRARLAELFAANAAALGGAPDWQKIAAALALRQGLTVISGGPGTGKTTTVVALLACLLAQDPAARIALAAPTGKAAARMTEAIRARAGHLPAELRALMPTQAGTIHRLLGVTRAARRFVHGADRPLPIDVLVIDEASMLDLALATRLFEAVPAQARVILLGDQDQLAAVEAGAVFAELSADPRLTESGRAALAAACGLASAALVPPAPRHASPLRDAVVWLTHTFRFGADSGIGRLAAEIRSGRAEDAIAGLRAARDADLRWSTSMEGVDPAAGYEAVFRLAAECPQDLAAVNAAFEHFRILCAVHEGPRGVATLNEQLTRRARQVLVDAGAAPDPRSAWYAGRPVMVLRNDEALRLYNGDVGIALPDASGALRVHFTLADGSFRAVDPLRLPAHSTAYAMTVHKSQGSEFSEVLVLLPERESPLLTRELVYTAITRARRAVHLVAEPAVLARAIGTPTRRDSGLMARMAELSAAREA